MAGFVLPIVAATIPKIRKVVVMLTVYGDESFDEKKERAFGVAGVIGSEPMWEAIEVKWRQRNGDVPFHANHCDSDYGEYRNRPHAENKALYRDLTIMLAESQLGGWGFVMDLADQKKFFPDVPEEFCYYRCFIEVLAAMKNCATTNGEQVKFTFDSRTESPHNAGMLYGLFRESPEWAHVMFPEISFAVSREHPRVQIADLFARESFKVYDNRFGPERRPVRKSWQALRETGRFHVECVQSEWFQSLKEQMSDIEKVTGMSLNSYRAWLSEFRLLDNMTNRFRYMEWCDKRDRMKT